MSYKQVKKFSVAKAGKKPGFCLQNTRLGFSIPAKYDTAWQAWQNTEQHKTRNVPKGLDLPLFYDYTEKGIRYGHINARLANGTICNDGKIYPSLAAFEKSHKFVKYVGWGESINEVKVVKEEEDMYKNHPANYWGPKYEKLHKLALTYKSQRDEARKLLELCKQQGPESNDAALKASLLEKIKGVFK